MDHREAVCIGCGEVLGDNAIPICANAGCAVLAPWARGARADAVVYVLDVPVGGRARLEALRDQYRLDAALDGQPSRVGFFPMRTAAAVAVGLERIGIEAVALPRTSASAIWLRFRECFRGTVEAVQGLLLGLPFVSLIAACFVLWLVARGVELGVRRIAGSHGNARRAPREMKAQARARELMRHELAVVVSEAAATPPELRSVLALLRRVRARSARTEEIVLRHVTRRIRAGRSLGAAVPRIAALVAAGVVGSTAKDRRALEGRLLDLECQVAAAVEVNAWLE